VISNYTWESTAVGYLDVIESFPEAAPPTSEIEVPAWFRDPRPENDIPLETLSERYFGSPD
jgi:sucrose-phosphate synthase